VPAKDGGDHEIKRFYYRIIITILALALLSFYGIGCGGGDDDDDDLQTSA